MTYNTKRREQIIKYFSDRKEKSLSLKEACLELTGGGKGESSVYRIVAALCEEGVLRKLTDPSSRHCRYQYQGGDGCSEHLHLKCNSCGKLIHLNRERSAALKQSVLSLGDFRLDGRALLFGECKLCARNG